MIWKLIGSFFSIMWKGYDQDVTIGKTKNTKHFQKIALGICFSAALLFTLSISYSAHADILTTPSSREAEQQTLQSNLPISPVAIVGQEVDGAVRERPVQANSAAVVGVFHEANEEILPLVSGKQVNQTSLVLVGAVLMALMVVVGLAISRREV